MDSLHLLAFAAQQVRKNKNSKFPYIHDQKYHCQHCHITFDRLSKLTTHQVKEHSYSYPKVASRPKEYSCNKCTYKTKHLGWYRRHMKRHKEKDTIFICRQRNCKYIATEEKKYQEHLKTHIEQTKIDDIIFHSANFVI